MAREEIGRAQLRRGVGIDAAGAHEAQGLGDAVGEGLILFIRRGVGEEAQGPAMDMFQIGIAAASEGTQQIERRRRLPIGHDLALGIGHAGGFGEGDVVDDVAAIGRQLAASMVSVAAERGLANWPAMRPTFTTGWPPAKVRTTAICRKTRKKSRMLSAECSAKLSAQSPP